MMPGPLRSALTLLVALALAPPLAALAQSTPADAAANDAKPAAGSSDASATGAKVAPGAADAGSAPRAAPAPTAPEKPEKIAIAVPAPAPKATLDFSGWLISTGWATFGALNSAESPRYALAGRGEQALGGSVRQSRLRVAAGVPSDAGLGGGAQLKALVEVDFAGGFASGDESAPLVRLRHAWASATWKHLGNLTVLAGQTTDVFHGSVAAASVAHVATPRFSGAGYLHRRAPQLRIQGDLGKELAVAYQVAALSGADKATQTPAATSVGYRSFAPDAEARLALLYRGAAPIQAELGAGARYGEERWKLTGLATPRDRRVKSQAVAVDVRLELPVVSVVGGAYAGENLDLVNSLAPGVKTTATGGKPTSVEGVHTRGAWAQLQLTPVKPLQLLVGGGVEVPRRADLPATFSLNGADVPSIYRNVQLSAGAIVSLTPRWKVGLEATRYATYGVDGNVARSDQVELSSLLAL